MTRLHYPCVKFRRVSLVQVESRVVTLIYLRVNAYTFARMRSGATGQKKMEIGPILIAVETRLTF